MFFNLLIDKTLYFTVLNITIPGQGNAMSKNIHSDGGNQAIVLAPYNYSKMRRGVFSKNT
jgi:hypothetical protein